MRSGLILTLIVCVAMLGGVAWMMLAPYAPSTEVEPRPRAAPRANGGGYVFNPDADRNVAAPLAGESRAADAGEAARVPPPPQRAGAFAPGASAALVVTPVPGAEERAPAVRRPHEQRRRRAEAALAEAMDVLMTDPANAGALRSASEAALGLERWSDACALFERRVDFEPDDVELRFAYASVLLRLAHWSSAARELNIVVGAAPDNGHAWYNLALAQQAAGQLAAAERSWSRAIELSPGDADARAQRGELRLDLHDWSGAADDLAAARARAPDDAATALNHALALAKGGRAADAERELLALHARRPRDVRVINRLAELAWEQSAVSSAARGGLQARAAEWCRRSLAIDADQPAVAALLSQATAPGAP